MTHDPPPDALVIRSTVRELVTTWQSTCDYIRSAFGMIQDAQDRLNATFNLGSAFGMTIEPGSHSRGANWSSPNEAIDRLRIDAWHQIVQRMELRRILSVSRWQELSKMVEKGEMPEITIENVSALASGHSQNIGAILEESIREVYDWLRPRIFGQGAKYKTNDRVEVGRKVVIPHGLEQYNTLIGKHRASYHFYQQLIAMENVFSVLDGHGWIAKTPNGQLIDAINASPDGTGETDFFRFKCYQNRNLHLEFLRTDLLAKFNAVAGGKNLKPGKEAA